MRSRQWTENEQVKKKNPIVLVWEKNGRFGSNKKTLKRENLNLKRKSWGFFFNPIYLDFILFLF